MPGVPSTDVRITNTVQKPGNVRDLANPAIDAFSIGTSLPINGSETRATYQRLVPEGKRMIIEHFSARASVRNAADRWVVTCIKATGGGEPVQHFLGPMTKLGVTGVHTIFVLSQPVRIYADAGTVVEFAVECNGGGTTPNMATFEIAASGHYVKVT